MDNLLAWLENSSAAWWFLIIIVAVALLDSVIPIVPSESAVILGGIAAARGDHRYLAVAVAAAVGAFVGDNIAYALGWRASGRLYERWLANPKTRARLEWAETQIQQRGGPLLVTARFVPGGRTAVTLSSGVTRQKWGWFVRWDIAASIAWAMYATTLGYVFGEKFADSHATAFIAAFAAALAVTGLIEVVRWARARRKDHAD